MIQIPITQLFMAGVFAVVLTEVVKWAVGITESEIGIHSGHSGELIKARVATIIYSVIVLVSNVLAFYAYELTHAEATANGVPGLGVESGLMIFSVIVIYIYLKMNHYSR